MSLFLLDFCNLHIMFIKKKSAIFQTLKKESRNMFEMKKLLKGKPLKS